MVQPCQILCLTIRRTQPFVASRSFCRSKSIFAAIARGRNDEVTRKTNPPPRAKYKVGDEGQVSSEVKQPRRSSLRRYHPANHIGGEHVERTRGPESLLYTTAASEFLYGYSSVLAAIKAKRRRIYMLYVSPRGVAHPGSKALLERARSLRINIREVGENHTRALDKASNGRPHNGFVLESSPLPVPPIIELASSYIKSASFEVRLDKQSKEDVEVNGTQEVYPYKAAGWRHPLVLYVDGVLDEGNLGAIARSAYFLGVDAIVTPSRQSATWSHVTVKASAGAAEGIPVFKVNQASDFLGRSARNGWRIYASDAIPPTEQGPLFDSSAEEEPLENFASRVVYTYARSVRPLPADHYPVANHPTILMMGSESTGLRNSLLNQAHYKVGIRHGRQIDEVGVDSLNVSVAASLLCFEMLQKPKPQRTRAETLF